MALSEGFNQKPRAMYHPVWLFRRSWHPQRTLELLWNLMGTRGRPWDPGDVAALAWLQPWRPAQQPASSLALLLCTRTCQAPLECALQWAYSPNCEELTPRATAQPHCPGGSFTGALRTDRNPSPTGRSWSSPRTWLAFLPSPPLTHAFWDHLPPN